MKLINTVLMGLLCCIIPVDAQAMFRGLSTRLRCSALRSQRAHRIAPLTLKRSTHGHSCDQKRIKALAMESNANQFSVIRSRYKDINPAVMQAIQSGGTSLLPSTYQRNPALKLPLVAVYDDLSKAASTLGLVAKDAKELQGEPLDVTTKKELDSFVSSVEFAHNNALNIRQGVYEMPEFKHESMLAYLSRVANALEAIACKK
jgi:hypothetical protein